MREARYSSLIADSLARLSDICDELISGEDVSGSKITNQYIFNMLSSATKLVIQVKLDLLDEKTAISQLSLELLRKFEASLHASPDNFGPSIIAINVHRASVIEKQAVLELNQLLLLSENNVTKTLYGLKVLVGKPGAINSDDLERYLLSLLGQVNNVVKYMQLQRNKTVSKPIPIPSRQTDKPHGFAIESQRSARSYSTFCTLQQNCDGTDGYTSEESSSESEDELPFPDFRFDGRT